MEACSDAYDRLVHGEVVGSAGTFGPAGQVHVVVSRRLRFDWQFKIVLAATLHLREYCWLPRCRLRFERALVYLLVRQLLSQSLQLCLSLVVPLLLQL